MYYTYQFLAKMRRHIKQNGVIAYPTESCYGFGCNVNNRVALRKILNIKQRLKAKGLIVVTSKLSHVKQVVSDTVDLSNQELYKYWPGAFSLIMYKNKRLNKMVVGKHNKIAIRLSANIQIKQICDFLDVPIISTSANISGKKSIKTYKECVRQFGHKLLVLPGLVGANSKPSTIIDWETKRIIRK